MAERSDAGPIPREIGSSQMLQARRTVSFEASIAAAMQSSPIRVVRTQDSTSK
ncbi:hypothetical protein Y88_1342 [Novosphingobium nitrogenifigens DSM 19370]|uniref:Uncharacterized protein n=1 Tax=Novosphingobium nitrogenifigens DSM 19370 TaxID=983920 RepID=F1Z7U5_9SPHN|nr:hypothetical protein Y88_1342 [Novosphingobium nitrogenifigens DSM 19370]